MFVGEVDGGCKLVEFGDVAAGDGKFDFGGVIFVDVSCNSLAGETCGAVDYDVVGSRFFGGHCGGVIPIAEIVGGRHCLKRVTN